MGDKMAFCPLAVLDDGWVDICAIAPGSRMQLVACMDEAKAFGRHVLGQPGHAHPNTTVTYGQVQEVVLRPATRDQVVEWKRSSPASVVAAANLAPEPMVGAASVNVDGDLCGFSPLRMVVCPRALPVVTGPV